MWYGANDDIVRILITALFNKRKKKGVIFVFTVDLISVSLWQIIFCQKSLIKQIIRTLHKYRFLWVCCFTILSSEHKLVQQHDIYGLIFSLCCLHFGMHKLCFVNTALGKKETKWMDKIKIKSRDCWPLFITVLVGNVRNFKRQLVILYKLPNKNDNKYGKYKYGSDPSSKTIFHIRAYQIDAMYGIFLFFILEPEVTLRVLHPTAGLYLHVLQPCQFPPPSPPPYFPLTFACEHLPVWMFSEGDHLSIGRRGGNLLYKQLQFKHSINNHMLFFNVFIWK